MGKLWICEKPAQAKLVAERIGGAKRADGFINTNDGIVTWCVGHLISLKKPGDLDEKWRAWNIESLPVAPVKFEYEAIKDKEKQVKTIGKLLKNSNLVVIATDGDREGELLGREMLDFFNWNGNIERMWNTSLDDESIDNALKNIKPGANTENLYHAASGRSEADYISGMTLTRAATKCFGNGDEILSVGRVQTALLGMIVKRDLEIENFKSRNYYELKASLSKDSESYYLVHAPKDEFRIFDKDVATRLRDEIIGNSGILSVEKKRKSTSPPKLFSLLTLQKIANKNLGWSASKTKKVAQSLYDEQLLSYPRTDCEFLPNEQEKDALTIIKNICSRDEFKNIGDEIGDELNFRSIVYNTAKTTAHHAIVPTQKKVNVDSLDDDKSALYLIVATRFLSVFMPDYEYDSTIIKLDISNTVFTGSGSVEKVIGWKKLYIAVTEEDENNQSFPNLEDGEQAKVEELEVLSKATKPLPRYTQASILSDMENISKFTEDPKILADIKARIKNEENAGIGTPATRDSFVDILVNRSYVAINKNKIISTDSGRNLIEALPGQVSDPIETVIMEGKLNEVVDGKISKGEFVKMVIDQTTSNLKMIVDKGETYVKSDIKNPCPECGKSLIRRKGAKGYFWGCSGFPECKTAMKDSGGQPVAFEPIVTKGECPDCGKPMAKREGKSGAKKKKYLFWGCTGYPVCKKTTSDKNGAPAF